MTGNNNCKPKPSAFQESKYLNVIIYINIQDNMSMAAYTVLFFTVSIILVPFFIIINGPTPQTEMQLRPICFANQQPQWNVCVSCFERSNEAFIAGRALVVEDSNEFLFWELPGSQVLKCQEALQFVDFQKTKGQQNKIVFESDSAFEEFYKNLQVKKHEQTIQKIQVSSNINHFAGFKVGAKWNANLSVRQISKESVDIIKVFTIKICQIGLVFFAFYFFYLLITKRKLRFQLIINTCILLMVMGFWLEAQKNYSFLINYATCLFLCLCLLKGDSKKLQALMLIVVFVFFDYPEMKVVMMFAAFCLFLFHSQELKQPTSYKLYIGFCLLAFSASQFFEVFFVREQSNNIFCEVMENMLLSTAPIMVQLIGATEKEEFKELIVSKEKQNKEKGFQKLTSGDEMEEVEIIEQN